MDENYENPLSIKGTIFSDFSDSIGIVIPSNLLQNIFVPLLFLFTIFYLIASGILFYHWETYGMKNKSIVFANIVFLLVSLILFIFAFILAFNL